MWSKCLDGISKNLAFFPPNPPTYSLARHGDGDQALYLRPESSSIRKVPHGRAQLLTTRKGETIVALFIPPPGVGAASNASIGAGPVRYTLLHSHGNAVDLGAMAPLYAEMARLLHVNVVSYDYTGYGRSTGTATVSATLADITAVMEHLQQEHGLRADDVVLYGQSVGSGPTCHLAAQLPSLAGVVLHSAFLSGMRVLNPGWTRWPGWADIYPNYKLVPRIKSPLLVLHGTKDEVIDVSHGRQLHTLAQRPSEPLWPQGYSHDNVESCPEYIPRLRRFLAECFGDGYRQQLASAGVKLR